MSIEIRDGYEYKKEIEELFTEYTQMLADNDETIRKYLVLQNYDDELIHLEAKYGRPEGRLYLAWCDGQPAGCIAMRNMGDGKCEMKRFYVKPEFRNRKIGSTLMKKLLDAACREGYGEMYLDTLPFLKEAVGMYRKAGFQEIEIYNDSPMENSIFMKLDLSPAKV